MVKRLYYIVVLEQALSLNIPWTSLFWGYSVSKINGLWTDNHAFALRGGKYVILKQQIKNYKQLINHDSVVKSGI